MRRTGLALVGVVALAGCTAGEPGDAIAPSGSGTTRTFAVQDFDAIALAAGDDIDVRTGTGFSVRAEGPADELDTLRIGRDDNRLVVARAKRVFGFGSRHGIKVFVTLPRLSEATVVGSGTMAVDRVEGTRFEANVAGSGDLNVAALGVDDAELTIAGSGDVRAGGAAKRLKANIVGSGGLDAAGLRVAEADVTVAGSGSVRAAVTGTAKVALMGSGDVDLGAVARCTISKRGSGSVRCGQQRIE